MEIVVKIDICSPGFIRASRPSPGDMVTISQILQLLHAIADGRAVMEQ